MISKLMSEKYAKHMFLVLMLAFLAATPYDSRAQNPQITSVSWTPQGEQIAVGYDSGVIEVTDLSLNSTQLVGRIVNPILNLSWSPTLPYRLVPTTQFINYVRLFDPLLTGDAQLVEYFEYSSDPGFGVPASSAGVDTEWSPNGTQIASAHNYLRGLNFRMFENQSIAIWDVATGEILYEYQPHIEPITNLEWSPDVNSGLLASTALDSTIVIWDVPNNQPAHVLITPFVFDAAWSPDGTLIAAAAADKVYIWELASRSVIREIPLLDMAGYSIDWSTDGTRLAFSDGYSVRVVDAVTGQDVIVYPVDRVPLQLAWSSQGQLAIPDGGELEIVTPPLPSNTVPTLTPTLTFTPTNTPTSTFTPTNTPTPTSTFTPTRTPTPTNTPIPLPPANTNLLTNSSFASGLAPWNTVNFSAGGVVNGLLEVTQPTSVVRQSQAG